MEINLNKFKKAKDIVEECLREDKRCRDDDLWLILSVWRKQGIRFYVNYKDLKEMVSTETITRHRRKIQNDEGRYLPTKEDIAIKRNIKEHLIRQYYSKYGRRELNAYSCAI